MWKNGLKSHDLIALMPKIFVVEDQSHAEPIGEFSTIGAAWDELRRLSAIPWDAAPNAAPCGSWESCGRDYEIVEYDTTDGALALVQRYSGLEVSAKGVTWGEDAPDHGA
ncbi:hypothetical protein ASD78_06770 [Lysobacter sp. Root667]|uniref:hypothetical protein n=1 Tax=Lysobacter sp. Root667 TaxID=1736581 RepID=UPI0006F1D33C|nr:hypothetical protein [Lysobacter sp. Root667]KRA75670.1 hypothetical protein ASD78_06770 [Lysobacter sp. Root667]